MGNRHGLAHQSIQKEIIMITLFGIDENGNTTYTFKGETNDLADHMKIAQKILDHQPHIHYVAIVLERIEIDTRTVSFETDLLHLVRRPLRHVPR